jgi:hypothetical protein
MGSLWGLIERLLVALGLWPKKQVTVTGHQVAGDWRDDEDEDEDEPRQAKGERRYPYRLRDDFLSPAELSFFRVLQVAADGWAVALAKVSLGDLFYAASGDSGENRAYRNKIDRKHVDFLLCDPRTIAPLVGIELDDRSHQRADRQRRDSFVERVFGAAGLPLARVPARRAYAPAELRAMLRQQAGLGAAEPVASQAPVVMEPAAVTAPVWAAPAIAPVAPAAAPAAPRPALAVAAAPNCPRCGAPMVLRTIRSGERAGAKLWGCRDYPRCRGVRAWSG